MRLVIDAETNLSKTHIWLVISKDLDTGEILCHTESSSLKTLIEASEQVIGHNLVGFDRHILQKLWGITVPQKKTFDTLIVSRLLKPDIVGGHNLDAWGRRLKSLKKEWPKEDFDNPALHDKSSELYKKLEQYCRQDVNLTGKLYFHLKEQLKRQRFSEYSVELEHEVAFIIDEQHHNGVLVDEPGLMELAAEVGDDLAKLEQELVSTFEPTIVQLKTKQKVIPFNPGSRQQIVDRLVSRGWQPTEFTEKGNVILSEETLLAMEIPEAKLFLRYFELQKISSFLTNWTDKLDKDGRIHGTVISNGAATGRMTHSSPNLGQVPSARTELGRRCRALFIVPEGHSLVGIDADGLELRMLAHYMQDDEYIRAVDSGRKEDKSDVHSVNQRAAGIDTRDNAKTFIYAYLYGAGDEKIGSIVKGTAKDGKRLKEAFLAKTPALAALKDKVTKLAEKGSLPGLDGRRLYTRSAHSALNTLLQGAGACVMKVALVILYRRLTEAGIAFKFVLNVHDEWQIECPTQYAEQIGEMGKQAIKDSGIQLKLRCPLAGDAKIGRNWYETH